MLSTCALYGACKADGPYEACTLMHRDLLHIHTCVASACTKLDILDEEVMACILWEVVPPPLLLPVPPSKGGIHAPSSVTILP